MTIYARSAPFRRKLFTIAGATGVLGGIGYYHYATRPRVNVVGHDTDDPLIGPGLDTARPKKEPLFNLDRIPAFVAKRFETKAPPNGIFWNSASNMVMVAVGTTSKFFLKAFAPTKVFNREPFLALLDDEDRERPIITGKSPL
jgi:hypothetical protein